MPKAFSLVRYFSLQVLRFIPVFTITVCAAQFISAKPIKCLYKYKSRKSIYYIILIMLLGHYFSFAQTVIAFENEIKDPGNIKTGAERVEEYLKIIKEKNVAVVANQASYINKTHLVDSLISLGVKVKKVFCPEHGFRGTVDAGETVDNQKDKKTGLSIISLYGKNKKPSSADLKDIDIVVFDIQDVGVRFYTYLSTLHYVMEACAENKKKCIVLDRPNPNGYYIDGPVLEEKYKSFLGMHPVPLVYGMTIGEYAQMINGEGWLNNKIKCDLTVIKLIGYSHNDLYQLPIKPSPNLPNMTSVYLYPSLGLFEGTVVAVGRGTDLPFQVIGHPKLKNTNYKFTPQPKPGASNPKYNGELCNGFNLVNFGSEYIQSLKKLYLFWLMGTYSNTDDKTTFFDENFNYHAGNSLLQEQIKKGITEDEIRKTWQAGIENFKKIRKKYLLYPDFY